MYRKVRFPPDLPLYGQVFLGRHHLFYGNHRIEWSTCSVEEVFQVFDTRSSPAAADQSFVVVEICSVHRHAASAGSLEDTVSGPLDGLRGKLRHRHEKFHEPPPCVTGYAT